MTLRTYIHPWRNRPEKNVVPKFNPKFNAPADSKGYAFPLRMPATTTEPEIAVSEL